MEYVSEYPEKPRKKKRSSSKRPAFVDPFFEEVRIDNAATSDGPVSAADASDSAAEAVAVFYLQYKASEKLLSRSLRDPLVSPKEAAVFTTRKRKAPDMKVAVSLQMAKETVKMFFLVKTDRRIEEIQSRTTVSARAGLPKYNPLLPLNVFSGVQALGRTWNNGSLL